MKKMSFVFIMLVGIISLCFANTTWKFESGSKELGYKVFDSVTVINRTGKTLQVENEGIQSDSEAIFQIDSILVSSDAYTSDTFEVACAIKDGNLEVLFSTKDGYKNMTVEVVPVPGSKPVMHHARPVHVYTPHAPCPQSPRPPRHHHTVHH